MLRLLQVLDGGGLQEVLDWLPGRQRLPLSLS